MRERWETQQKNRFTSEQTDKQTKQHDKKKDFGSLKNLPPVGLEPTASGLEVRRAIHCATRAHNLTSHHGIVISYLDIDLARMTRNW